MIRAAREDAACVTSDLHTLHTTSRTSADGKVQTEEDAEAERSALANTSTPYRVPRSRGSPDNVHVGTTPPDARRTRNPFPFLLIQAVPLSDYFRPSLNNITARRDQAKGDKRINSAAPPNGDT